MIRQKETLPKEFGGAEGFSLLEVLVAFVIVSISLSWALYMVSSASSLSFKCQEEIRVRNLLYETYGAFISDQTHLSRLLEGDPIEVAKGDLLLRYQYQVFWPFKEEYLNIVRFSSFSPPEVLEKIKDLPGRETPFLGIIRAEAWRGESLILRLFIRPPSG